MISCTKPDKSPVISLRCCVAVCRPTAFSSTTRRCSSQRQPPVSVELDDLATSPTLQRGPDDLDPGRHRPMAVRASRRVGYADIERFTATVEPALLAAKLQEAITGNSPRAREGARLRCDLGAIARGPCYSFGRDVRCRFASVWTSPSRD